MNRLLVVDWAAPAGDRPRPIMYFLFDCGTLHDPGRIHIQRDELDGHQFCDPDLAATRLGPNIADRLPAALSARASGATAYLPRYQRQTTH
ncbi:MAG TPA: hypothetical protein VFX70_17295 [Mycobacteriales bacterium]|nr:hypothetical protein [Mycobacteriales bacterium]